MPPYRAPTPLDEHVAAQEEPKTRPPTSELLPVLVVLWLASVARVVLGVMRHEVFQAEASLAFLAVCIVPFAIRRLVRE